MNQESSHGDISDDDAAPHDDLPEATAESTGQQPLAKAGPQKPLRLWPGVVAPLFALAAVFLPGFVASGTMFQFMGMMFGPMIGIAIVLIWWLFLSRAPWRDRFLVVGVFAVCMAGTLQLIDRSMPMALYMFGWQAVILLFTFSLIITRSYEWPSRRWASWVAIAVGWAMLALIRVDGLDGQIIPKLAFRFSETAEERYLRNVPEAAEVEGETDDSAPLTVQSGDWPGFRGPLRDSHADLAGADVIDWSRTPPRELWRRPIGPGWSSFTVIGEKLFTQEQRGENEVVLCLQAGTGKEIWKHETETRFWETIGGAGPRATPTFDQGRLYCVGANGDLLCLDAASGEMQWRQSIPQDGEVKTPMWGFASSPLIVGDLVVVFGGGDKDNSLLAYAKADGKVKWSAGDGAHSYASPQLAVFDDVPQILMATEKGLSSFEPIKGELLWRDEWVVPGYRVTQPNVLNNTVLYGSTGNGTRRLDVKLVENKWVAEEKWTSRGLKPYFNDFVIHEGHVYGFDNNIMACLDLETGERRWKGGRYGDGQLVLLAAQDLLLVTTEKSGEAVLVKASPDRHQEVARIDTIEGKTWNHPVVAHKRLFIRNDEFAIGFELTP